MTESDQPSTQGKPVPSPDKAGESGKKASVELTEDQLKKATGGITNPGTLDGPGHVRSS
jgi:hypothetical protein